MKLHVKIQEIRFEDVILKAMPALKDKAPKDGSAVAKIIAVLTSLPGEVIGNVLKAVPEQDLREIVALLVRDNQQKLKEMAAQLLQQYDVEASVDELHVSKDLDVCIGVSNLNYNKMAAKYLPLLGPGTMISENPVLDILSTLLRLPGVLLFAALAKIPQQKKDEMVALLVNKYQDKIMAKIEEMLAKQNIHVRLAGLNVEV